MKAIYCILICILGSLYSCERPECPEKGPAMLFFVKDTTYRIKKLELLLPEGQVIEMIYGGKTNIYNPGPKSVEAYYYEFPLQYTTLEVRMEFKGGGVNRYRLDYKPVLEYNEPCKFMNYTIADHKVTILQQDTIVNYLRCVYDISANTGELTRHNTFGQVYEHAIEIFIHR
jgi:hypothetical protein